MHLFPSIVQLDRLTDSPANLHEQQLIFVYELHDVRVTHNRIIFRAGQYSRRAHQEQLPDNWLWPYRNHSDEFIRLIYGLIADDSVSSCFGDLQHSCSPWRATQPIYIPSTLRSHEH